MYSWRNFRHKFMKYGMPEQKEVTGLLITAVVFAFIISFREWGATSFSPAVGFSNFFVSFMLMVIALIVFGLGHRTFSLWMGYRSQYRTWIPGLLISMVFTFISNGYIPLMLIGGLTITTLEIHRLGTFQPEMSFKQAGWIGMAGSVALIIFAVILKPFAALPVIAKLMKICILLAIFNMLPIPPMNGLRTFFGSRFVYVFVTASIIACGALLGFVGGFLSLLGGIVLGALILLVFFVYIDKRW